MISSEFRIASASDLHLGHGKNPAIEMVERFKNAFPRDAETAKLDALVLAGDVYDHLLNLPQDEVSIIDEWMLYTLRLCKALDIALWVLRGTPSHDRNQSERFVLLNRTHEIGCDLTYVDELKIIYFPRFGINVLFVPDEWTDSEHKTLEEVHQLMKINGLKQVDYAIMHGQFEYQLPPVVKAQKHSSEDYLKLVKYLIFIGHVHIFSRNDRIIAQGSLDRISHGEEGPKGHVRAIVRDVDDFEIHFVETLDAKRFVTVQCRGIADLDVALKKIEETVAEVPEDSHVRLVADVGSPILQLVSDLEKTYPFFYWTALAKSDEEKTSNEQAELLQNQQEYVPIEITSQNVEKLLLDVMLARNYDMATINLAEKKLAELV